jgi:hypothetical protein
MPEFSELQQLVLEIIQEHAQGNLLGSSECFLTNEQIFNLITPSSLRPCEYGYLSTVLKRLAVKKRIEVRTKSVVGYRGLKRIITIL